MERRSFLKGLALLGLCPLCATAGVASGSPHWSYEGEAGPEKWGTLGEENLVCSAGSYQSPINITGAIKADIPDIAPGWKNGAVTVVNNGHTIQVNFPPGSKLVRGDRVYDLVQFHLHAPSEHQVEGQSFPMETHYVHKSTTTNDLGVLGVFLVPGAANPTFASLAAAFPAEAGAEVPASDFDPSALLPSALRHWAYEGSLTTPPCSEVVNWMVAMQPVEVAGDDIARFTTIYAMNARPILPANRRFILASD